MWLVIARAPRPDAPQWPGRRALAVVDALLWPACLMLAALHLPPRAGIVQGAVVAISCFAALRGVYRAALNNRRYRFTTWQVARWMAALLALGVILKLWFLLSA